MLFAEFCEENDGAALGEGEEIDGGGAGMEESDEEPVCCAPFDGTGGGLIGSNATGLFDFEEAPFDFVFVFVAVSSTFEAALFSGEVRDD